MNRKVFNRVINLFFPVSSTFLGSPRRILESMGACDSHKAEAQLKFKESVQLSASFTDVPSVFATCIPADEWDYYIAVLPCGRVWGRNGAVITCNDAFVRDVSREFNIGLGVDHSIFYTLKQKKALKLDGDVAVIGTAGANIYYHWMLDILPRIGLLGKYMPLEVISYFITEFNRLPFQCETLIKAGIPLSRIMASNDNWNFQIEGERLWVPSLAGPLDQPTAYQVEYLRELFKENISTAGSNRLLYISRRKEGRRTILNEEMIISELKTKGFEIIICEDLAVSEQVKIFSEAKVIVGPHGSAFTNLSFCNPGTRVIDILSSSHINPCFWFLSQLRGLDYRFMVGSSAPIDANPKNDNVMVDMTAFMNLLLQLGI